jgi:ABC-type antimicrobial peptide transport system permease subunit
MLVSMMLSGDWAAANTHVAVTLTFMVSIFGLTFGIWGIMERGEQSEARRTFGRELIEIAKTLLSIALVAFLGGVPGFLLCAGAVWWHFRDDIFTRTR